MTMTTTPDADLADMNPNELLAVVASTAIVLRQADAARTRQARAMRLMQQGDHRHVKRADIAERAGVSESAVRQAIKNLEKKEGLAAAG
jgi:DNA-binding MarR family transcriptional regulator